MRVSLFLLMHVGLSLIGIVTGVAVLYGLTHAQRMEGMTILFLFTTAATSVSGFFFPFHGFTPAIGVGIVSCGVLIFVLAARYVFHLAGTWRAIYAGGVVLAFYLNTFVLVVQAFQKVPALNALAPNGNEPPFLIAQAIVLIFFALMGVLALRRFHPV